MTNITNPLRLTSVQERLWRKYARLKRSRVTRKKNNEKMALTAKAFLGWCYVSGKFGHKEPDFPDKEKI